MVRENRQADKCPCSDCQRHPRSSEAREHRVVRRLVLSCLDERSRRLLAGFYAQLMGRGGIAQVAKITALDRKTIAKGRRELKHGKLRASHRIRKPGAGRKPLEHVRPGS